MFRLQFKLHVQFRIWSCSEIKYSLLLACFEAFFYSACKSPSSSSRPEYKPTQNPRDYNRHFTVAQKHGLAGTFGDCIVLKFPIFRFLSDRIWRIFWKWIAWHISCCPSALSWFHSRTCWMKPITRCQLLTAGSRFMCSGNLTLISSQTTATTRPQTGQEFLLVLSPYFDWFWWRHEDTKWG